MRHIACTPTLRAEFNHNLTLRSGSVENVPADLLRVEAEERAEVLE